MATAVWTGTLSFGLVTIPVKLVNATEPKDVRFHLMDREGRRVRYRRVVEGGPSPTATSGRAPIPDEMPVSGREVIPEPGVTTSAATPPRETEIDFRDLVRGYETDDGRTVVVTPEEIEMVKPRRSRVIDVEDFVELGDVDPVYFEKTYYMIPNGREAEEPYVLLLRAMQRAGRAGIGRFVLRTKPHLVAIRPMDEALVLHTLFFGDEVRDAARFVDARGAQVDERKLELAASLIEMLKTDWVPSAYADAYREDLLRIIAEKEPLEATGAEPEAQRLPQGDRVDELMRALMQSVEAVKRRGTRRREAS